MSYNLDELVPPEWIDSDFLKTVIESSGKDKNVKINDFKITPATAVGDHFASIMFRANVNFSSHKSPSEKISLIIKAFPVEEGFKKEALRSMNLFETEIYVYTKILSDIQTILNAVGYTELLAPKALYSSLDPHQVIVFEDLKDLGYFMIPTNLPNEHEIRLIFAKLAQYHAATFKMNADGREDLKFKGTLFNFSLMKKMDMFSTGYELMADVLESVPELKDYGMKLRGIKSDCLLEKCAEIVNEPPAFGVLNHGDYHIRNMMFKNNEFNAVSEIVLVDFQIPHWGSPAYDLLYISTALSYDQRQMAFRHYFNVFCDVLIKTGYKGKMPTYEVILDEVNKYAYLDLVFASAMALFPRFDKELLVGQDPAKIMTDPEFRKTLYKTPSYVEYVKDTVPKILDVMFK